MRLWLATALLVATSCARCGSAPADAGAHLKQATDLRTVLLLIFPEYRGTEVEGGEARLTRTLSGSSNWRAVLAATLAHTGFAADDGGTGGTRAPFAVAMREQGRTATFTVSMPLDSDTVQRIFYAPLGLSTLQLGLMLPAGEGLTVEGEVFELELHYQGFIEHRAAFTSRQVVDLLLKNQQWSHHGLPDAGWMAGLKPDGGIGEVPDEFILTLEGKVDGALIEVHRSGKRVDLKYTLVTGK